MALRGKSQAAKWGRGGWPSGPGPSATTRQVPRTPLTRGGQVVGYLNPGGTREYLPGTAQATPQESAAGLPGGGFPGGPAGLRSQYDASDQEAKMANLQRYANLLERGQGRYDTAMGMIGGMGKSEQAAINEQYDAQLGTINQDLIGRGLSNTSIKQTMAMGNLKERQRAQVELQDRLLSQRLGAHTGLSGDIMGVMERRTDAYPDQGAMQQLAQQYGQATGQGGGGGPQGPYIAGIRYANQGGYGQQGYGQQMTPQRYLKNMRAMTEIRKLQGAGGPPATAGGNTNQYMSDKRFAQLVAQNKARKRKGAEPPMPTAYGGFVMPEWSP